MSNTKDELDELELQTLLAEEENEEDFEESEEGYRAVAYGPSEFERIAERADAAFERGDFETADDLYAEIGDEGYSDFRRTDESLMDAIWNGRL